MKMDMPTAVADLMFQRYHPLDWLLPMADGVDWTSHFGERVPIQSQPARHQANFCPNSSATFGSRCPPVSGWTGKDPSESPFGAGKGDPDGFLWLQMGCQVAGLPLWGGFLPSGVANGLPSNRVLYLVKFDQPIVLVQLDGCHPSRTPTRKRV